MLTAPVIWLTGIPASGKTTLAKALIQKLQGSSVKCENLDGDVLRTFYPKLGFSKEERSQHVRSVALTAHLLAKHGITVVVSLVSPIREDRDFARSLCPIFFEIFLDPPLAVCQSRDPKGLYAKAKKGELQNLTGFSAPYENPLYPELQINTDKFSILEASEKIYALVATKV